MHFSADLQLRQLFVMSFLIQRKMKRHFNVHLPIRDAKSLNDSSTDLLVYLLLKGYCMNIVTKINDEYLVP